NIIGNVLGDLGYHHSYQSVAPAGTESDTSIFTLGWSGNGSSDTIEPILKDDSLVATTLMRWGNYDVVAGRTRFDASEVPTGLTTYANPVPSTERLPASLYLARKPTFFGSAAFPAIGPDVSAGMVPNVSGHAQKIPARLCYESTSHDENGILNF